MAGADLPPNRWTQVRQDATGARRGSAMRYVPEAGAFFLWGFFDADPGLLQEQPLMEAPEYDIVAFTPAEGRWRNHLPRQREAEWNKKLPLAYIPRTYSAITTGSERTVLRGPTGEPGGVPRPDLNIVFDQVAWHPSLRSLVYFTGGLTAAYCVAERTWTDLSPHHSPPPVLGGSLAYDPVNRELVLFGGGHVVERAPDGKIAGYTGTWVYRDNDWRRLPPGTHPPPRMNTRLVCDTRNQVLVLFGGDGQSQYLADTWLYYLKTRTWRASRASAGPEARAGHFTVYDQGTGWVIIGGGYNRRDLADMWAYDAAEDRWRRLPGEAPAGFYLTADIAPERRLILLAANTRTPESGAPGDRASCNALYPVRTTYAFRIDTEAFARAASPAATPQQSIPKRPPLKTDAGNASGTGSHNLKAVPLRALPVNQWVLLSDPGRTAPARTWGSATFDTDRGLILYWGGGHCGYGGNDVDAYDVEAHTWRAVDPAPEFPQRAWDKGVRLAGVTFQGRPWTDHGRRIYAYDPISRKMIMVRAIRLTAGYEPEALRDFPEKRTAAEDALASNPSSYVKYATFAYDPAAGNWVLLGPAAAGLDTLVTTPRGVMGVNVDWPSRLNDAGYLLPWRPSQEPRDSAVYLLDAAQRRWNRLGAPQHSPQNLYEATSLAYDSKRERLILHGGGPKRDELWTLDFASRRWTNMRPKVVAPAGAAPPVASREAVYLPRADAFLTCGPAPENRAALAAWTYSAGENAWRRVEIPFAAQAPRGAAGQNRAMVYDPKHDLVLLVLGTGGDEGKASVYAMRYQR